MGRRCFSKIFDKKYITKPKWDSDLGGYVNLFMFESDNNWYTFEEAFVTYPPSKYNWVFYKGE